MNRKVTRQITLGGVKIGGNAPIVVQSMTNTDTRDYEATIEQIKGLEEVGCEVVRVAVPDMDAAIAIGRIREKISIPLIADIHFDYRLAIEAMHQGIDGLRINPGNIGERWKVEELVRAAMQRDIPIRIGVNAGSLEKGILQKYGHPTPEALVESAERHINILEAMGFKAIKVSLKASDVMTTIQAYRLFSERFDYPIHIGISEAGPLVSGTVKSAVGLGILLSEGIGDTIRVSLTAEPRQEVIVAYEILKAIGLKERGPHLVSCPTCGRCEIDIIGLAGAVEEMLFSMKKDVKVAVMGCVVNGPGEAREADVGIAGGKGVGIIFRKGKVVKKVSEDKILDALMEEIERL